MSLPPTPAPQLILVGDHTVPLPPDVTAPEWALERNNYQNSRIRVLLGAIRMLDGVRDSNYAILNCSPERLSEMWRRVRAVTDTIRNDLAPLLEHSSVVPALERARLNARISVRVLRKTALEPLDRYPAELPPERSQEMRKLIGVSIGKLDAFLQDTFGEIMAADPRSLFDRDYFLSRRFPRDVEEAEWLYRGVANLGSFLHEVARESAATASGLARRLEQEEMLPSAAAWEGARQFIDLLADLTKKLREILALRGIRFDELEVLDLYSGEIPAKCNRVLALHRAGRDATDRIKASAPEDRPQREQSVVDLIHCHAVSSREIARQLADLHEIVEDLAAFVPIWLKKIGTRRALLLYASRDTERAA